MSQHFHPPSRSLLLVVSIVLSLVAVSAASADEPDRKWNLGLEVVAVTPSGDPVLAVVEGDQASFDVTDGTGFGLRLGYQPSRRWSFGLAVRTVDLDTELRLATANGQRSEAGTLELEMYWLSAEYHCLLRPKWSLFVGAMAVMSKGSDQVFATPGGQTKLTFDDDFGFGAILGTQHDLGSGGRWQLRIEAAYLTTILETDSGFADFDLDPTSVAVGLAVRF